ncbi:MAG: FtsW/RodA/SpoVE family cell cycle protein [Firmicutes bacterium]|nr:FtsW/RodA/SpoVE family cell cycle protein [Bacillota bacterium]
MLYIGIFLLDGLLISLSRQGVIKVDIAKKLSNQRLQIMLMHITASIIFISTAEASRLQSTVTYCAANILLAFFANLILRLVYKNSAHALYNCIFMLSSIGLIMLYRLNPALAYKQMFFHIGGIAILLLLPPVLTLLPRLDKFKILYILICFGLLIATLKMGTSQYGSKNWLKIGSFGFQPSEFIKILFVLYLASAFSSKPKFSAVIVPTLLTLGVIAFLVVQKDLGSALIFFMTYLALLFIATGNYLYVLMGLASVSFASVIAYKLFSHIRVRVAIWQNPWSDVTGDGYQIAQSLFAICTRGITGIGLTRGYAQKIPVVERDFIFAAICEEFGVIFAIGLIFLFVLLFLEGARCALNSKSRFLTLMCAGLAAVLAFQSFIIIGGVVKFIPLTGVTLPFVSYGGTSLLVCYIIIAIIQWVFTRNNKYTAMPAVDTVPAIDTEFLDIPQEESVDHTNIYPSDRPEETFSLNDAIPPKKAKPERRKPF